jgi:ABC-type lipoprotein release transport system permease subunit
MRRFLEIRSTTGVSIAAIMAGVTFMGMALFLALMSSPASAQARQVSVFNGHTIIYPASSIPQGRPSSYQLLLR